MEAGGTTPAGSGRCVRLDPFALPVRFPANDSGADGQVRQVELDCENVVVRRAVRGISMKVGLPVSAFRGLVVRSLAAASGSPATCVILDHRDRALAVTLYVGRAGEDVTPVWKAWGRVLRLPLLTDGHQAEPLVSMIGQVALGAPSQRRRRRTALRRRRPRIFLRRKPGCRDVAKAVHRSEREIIARN